MDRGNSTSDSGSTSSGRQAEMVDVRKEDRELNTFGQKLSKFANGASVVDQDDCAVELDQVFFLVETGWLQRPQCQGWDEGGDQS